MSDIDTGTDDVLATVEAGVAVLTMNRPERRNALSESMLAGLATVLAQVETDDSVRCVVLTGAGGAFCAGGDVKGMAQRGRPGADGAGSSGAPEGAAGAAASPDAAVLRQQVSQRAVSGRLWSMPKPTIAAISGPAAGAGLGLALACDLRYAVAGAVLTTAFARVGFSGDYGTTWFLPRLVGSGKAKELFFFSDRLSPEEAEELGIVNDVFAPADFEREVMARARRLAAGPTLAYRYMKENLNRAVHGQLFDCMDVEVTHHGTLGATEDHREAALAFVEKRDPVFKGR